MDNQQKLQEVIRQSWFVVTEERYVYTSVKKLVNPEQHLMTINDGLELTIVTSEKNLSSIGDYKSNKERWRLLNIRCGNPFYCVGFIAYITGALADHGIDIVLTSSFSNDLVLVMEQDLEKSIAALIEIGFEHRAKETYYAKSLES